jgi:hypothetical protein
MWLGGGVPAPPLAPPLRAQYKHYLQTKRSYHILMVMFPRFQMLGHLVFLDI